LEDDDFFLVKSLDLEDEEGLNFEDLIAWRFSASRNVLSKSNLLRMESYDAYQSVSRTDSCCQRWISNKKDLRLSYEFESKVGAIVATQSKSNDNTRIRYERPRLQARIRHDSTNVAAPTERALVEECLPPVIERRSGICWRLVAGVSRFSRWREELVVNIYRLRSFVKEIFQRWMCQTACPGGTGCVILSIS
jgi:hypothetical protein